MLNNYASSSVSEMSIIIIEKHGKQRVQPVFKKKLKGLVLVLRKCHHINMSNQAKTTDHKV